MPNLFYALVVAGTCLASISRAQTAAPLTGTVVDARTQAAVPYATLAAPGYPGGTVSNAEGTFQLVLPPGADSVRVQALGYAPLVVATKVLAAAPGRPLRLQPQAYQLQEVTVTAFTPTALLRQAVRRTTALMASPVGLQAYYREFTIYNGQVAKFADALVDYYLVGNPRRPRSPQVQVRVTQSRAGEAALDRDDARRAIPSPVSVEWAGDYYDVIEKNPYLDSTNFQLYSYAVLETPASAAEAPYYEVHCTPITQERNHLREATVHIDRRTLTIRHIECEVPARLQPYLFSLSLFGIRAQAIQERQRVDYQLFNGRLYPSFVRLQYLMDITKGSQLFRYEFASDMLVRNLAATPTPFPKAERYDGSLYKRGTHYTQDYWREGNVVPATAAEEAAIQALASPVR